MHICLRLLGDLPPPTQIPTGTRSAARLPTPKIPWLSPKVNSWLYASVWHLNLVVQQTFRYSLYRHARDRATPADILVQSIELTPVTDNALYSRITESAFVFAVSKWWQASNLRHRLSLNMSRCRQWFRCSCCHRRSVIVPTWKLDARAWIWTQLWIPNAEADSEHCSLTAHRPQRRTDVSTTQNHTYSTVSPFYFDEFY